MAPKKQAGRKVKTSSSRVVTENLDVKLSEQQKQTASRELAATINRIVLIEEDKKSTAAEYAAQLKVEHAEEKRLAHKITTGLHRQPINVEIKFDYRKKRMIKTRLDTKEVIENRPLLKDETQMPLE